MWFLYRQNTYNSKIYVLYIYGCSINYYYLYTIQKAFMEQILLIVIFL